MEYKVDKDEFTKFVTDTLRKSEQLGSIIFPATGNEKFDEVKLALKERIKLCKDILKQLKTSDIINI
jgi:hypothetical protein